MSLRGPVGGAPYDGVMERTTAEIPMEACRPVTESKRLPCDACGHPMEPEHAHYRCPACGYILPCCGW
jgi:rubrerythrin